MIPARIALVGDFSPAIVAHEAINACFALADCLDPGALAAEWVSTETIVPGSDKALAGICGFWCVPGSPYRHPEGALWAIQFARTRRLPFLGTCGGYQHALLEFARNQLGIVGVEHSEENPAAPVPLIHRMTCSLIEQLQEVTVTAESFRSIYGTDSGMEGYHCSYGLNPAYEKLFASSQMHIVARSTDGQARACQLHEHPFFIGTQFQPERRALTGSLHPVVKAFFSAAMRFAAR